VEEAGEQQNTFLANYENRREETKVNISDSDSLTNLDSLMNTASNPTLISKPLNLNIHNSSNPSTNSTSESWNPPLRTLC